MGLLSGFEKYGITPQDEKTLYSKAAPAQEKKEAKPSAQEVATDASVETKSEREIEAGFLFDKVVRCPVCDKPFKTKLIKSNRLRRMEPDADLRPNYDGIDSIKYDICSCPNCGYTAMNRYFEHLSSLQIKLIKESICSNFEPTISTPPDIYTYPEAIDRYKASLANTIVKHGKTSEIAYTCLKIAWLMRTYIPMMPEATEVEIARKNDMIADQREAYEQAYEGFVKAISNESYPIAGMDQHTLDFMLANMAMELGKIDVAAKLISGILVSTTAPSKMKDKALDMKQTILAALRKK